MADPYTDSHVPDASTGVTKAQYDAAFGYSSSDAQGRSARATTAKNFGIGLSLLGGGIGAWATLEAGKANAATDYANADLADQLANDVLAQSLQQETQRQKEGAANLGSARASYAGQGVVVDQGSAGEVQGQIRDATDQDVQTIRENARRQAWGLHRKADIAREAGDNALAGSKRQAAASLIGTVGTAAALGFA